MRISFRTSFTLRVRHDYYEGPCRGLAFVVPESTQFLLSNARARALETNGTLHVLDEVDQNDVPLVGVAGTTLLFGLKQVDGRLANVTAPFFSDATLIPYFENRASAAALDDPPIGVTIVPHLAAYVPTNTTRPLNIHLFDQANELVEVTALAVGELSARFKSESIPDGLYSIVEDDSTGPRTRHILVSRSLFQSGIWGVVAITTASNAGPGPIAFEVVLAARSDVLSYYIVASRFTQQEFDQLQVTDAGADDEGRLPIGFQRIPSSQFGTKELAPSLLVQADDRVVLFRSLAPVARRERGYRRLQLKRNGAVLVEHLPQPGASRTDANLIVQLSKP